MGYKAFGLSEFTMLAADKMGNDRLGDNMMALTTLKKAFKDQGMVFKDETCQSLASKVGSVLGLNATELAEEYEVFHINRGETVNVVSPELIEAFRNHLQSERAKARTKVAKSGRSWHTYSKYDLDDVVLSTKTKSFGDMKAPAKIKQEEFTIKTTFPRPKRPTDIQELQSSKKSAFSQRSQRGTNFASLTVSQETAPAETSSHNHAEEDRVGTLHRIQDGLSAYARGPAQDVKYMFDTLESKAKYLEHRICAFTEMLEGEYDIPASTATYTICNEPTVVVGRVCSDTAEGRINEASILLEGSMQHSKGLRVRVDTKKLGSLSLFPGQVVAVEGINPSGFCITALSILTGIPKPVTPIHIQQEQPPFRIAVACGPFSTAEDLSFEPMKAFIDKACEDAPEYLILCGPFVDRSHPLIRDGTIDVLFEDLFQICIESCNKLPKKTKVILIPSVRDVMGDPVFPQPAFTLPKLRDREVICVSNPTMLKCNNISLALTSHDILKHLSGTELFVNRGGTIQKDRMSRLAMHSLQQRVQYPLYPPARGACLDCGLALEAEGGMFFRESPNLLIMPSDLNAFAKEVRTEACTYKSTNSSVFDSIQNKGTSGTTFCLNPGRLDKGLYSSIHVNHRGVQKIDIHRI